MPHKTTQLNLVVAACNNMGIGIEGRLPWHLKQDMAFFKKITSTTRNAEKKNMVVMGKRTWLSLPPSFRPLPGRVNVVLSTQLTDVPEGVHIARNFNQALSLADILDIERVFIIGGASVYKEAMEAPSPSRIYLTRIYHDFVCDTFLPDSNLNQFSKVSDPENVPIEDFEENGIKFSIEVYDKIII